MAVCPNVPRCCSVRFEDDGNPSNPTIEITDRGNSEGPNALDLANIHIFQPFGVGLLIHNSGPSIGAPPRDIRIVNMMIEGSGLSNTTVGGDLFVIGDRTQTAPGRGVTDVLGRNIELIL